MTASNNQQTLTQAQHPQGPVSIGDYQTRWAEVVILGGMLCGKESFIRAGANTDFSESFDELIARSCVDAWQFHGSEDDMGWILASCAYMAKHVGYSPLANNVLWDYVKHCIAIYEWWLDEQGVAREESTLVAI